MKQLCDKCKSKIVDGKCDCGFWIAVEEFPELHPYEAAILKYNEMCEKSDIYSTLSSDHFTVTCLVIFKGNYDKCMKVKQYVDSLEVN